ncbi:hypothetical protein PRZ48_001481 [Zasmidium cellare]|uniref:Myb-like domain-containing protein n=1 Tax=Zasmidium cellare TaxID=395010 RepID=A0ABR0F310_ZASCE|nr:hypothetical protein PRZ48_001481 [Zasmidium cellare]
MWSPFIGLVVPKLKVYRVDSNTGQPLDPKVQAPPGSVHTDIKKDKNGKMVMVRHRSKNGSVVNGNENDTPKNGKNGKNGKNDNDANKDKGGDSTPFTADEDAKLKELKEGGGTWKNMAAEMNRPQHELKARWKEIEGKPGVGGDQKNDSGAKDNQAGGNDQKDGGGDFSKEEDDKIKELLASNTGFKKIAQELSRTLDKPFKDHINKLKAEAGGDNAKNDASKNDKGDQAEKKNDDNFSKKDKEKIKELLDSNTGYKQIAEALGRAKVDKPLKDEIAKIKAEGGDKKDDSKDKKKDGDGGGKKENQKKEKEKSKTDEPKKPASVAPSHRSHRSEARFTMEEWRILQEDEMFTFGELQLLSDIIMKDRSQSWLAIASRFLDKTGRRVHPDDIKDKFDQMAKMGR